MDTGRHDVASRTGRDEPAADISGILCKFK